MNLRFVGICALLAALSASSSVQTASQYSDPAWAPLDAREPIPYFIENGTNVPGYQEADRELAKMALDAWSRESAGRLKFAEVSMLDNAQVHLRWVDPRGGLFGETRRLPWHGKTVSVVYVIPEAAQLGGDLSLRAAEDSLLRDAIVYLTCVHELGHAVGLPHTRKFEDIMYSFQFGGNLLEYFLRYRNQLRSRQDITKHSGLSFSDIETLRKLYEPGRKPGN